MNLGRLEAELRLLILDQSLFKNFKQWLNDAVDEIAADFDLPTLRTRVPSSVTTTTATWIFAAPATFSKKLFQCYTSDYKTVHVCRDMSEIDALDIQHTKTGDRVTHVAVDPTDNSFCIYPRAAGTLLAWFYKTPTAMVAATDEPTCIPAAYRQRVILPKVIIKNYRLLQDLVVDAPGQSLMYWEQEYQKGLYGYAKGDIGMLNYFAKLGGPPRRHGGRDPLP